ncbi:MAG: protease Lon-related BREX system protein BrxL [Acholeplasmataceae bacterium]|nr:protease Lon-related BREX system protein BrxL [Acholeplasmataceae bacterium]
MDLLDKKVYENFSGRVVKKGATKKIKSSANVPTYVLEYLLGTYSTSNDDKEIQEGINQVKKILQENYVRPDEAEMVKSKIRETGAYTVIDRVSVKLDLKKNEYRGFIHSLGVEVIVPTRYVTEYEKLLSDGIWCIVSLSYFYDEDERGTPFKLTELTPIQVPNMDINEVIEARKNFTKDEWIDLLLRSTGMEPTQFETREKWHLLARLTPLIENNINICELGPRGTGKSHIYKELSPNSILISGGQTTVANLFYNLARRTPGLVSMWDTVAFDEVAGITFKDKDGIQIMKDYMASGSFARGKEMIPANASMVFVGNINQSVESLLKTSHLFEPFPEAMIDSAFFDRMHIYVPGWEIPKMRPEYFTDNYGFISDYFSEFLREMRKVPMTDAFDKYFKLGSQLNQRDTIAVRKVASAFTKLIYPDGNYTKDDMEELLAYAIEGRRRVKEQLKKIGGMEFYDVQLSYIDLDTMDEKFVPVLEQGGGKIIPEGPMKPGHIYTVARGSNGMIGTFKLETQISNGSGKFTVTGLGNVKDARESVKTAEMYYKANSKAISPSIMTDSRDYVLHIHDAQGVGLASSISMATLIAYSSASLNKHVQTQLVVLGSFSIGGTINKVENLSDSLQVCLDAGAKRVLIPMSSAADIATVPADLFAKFQISFYSSPEDAVIKSLGIE